jgi:glycosyltransferase involved in cell wall biosynthesis
MLRQRGIRHLVITDNRDLDFGGWVKALFRDRFFLVYQQHMRLGITKKDPLHTLRFRRLDAWITLLPYMEKEIRQKTLFPSTRVHLIPLGLEMESLLARKLPKKEARQHLELPHSGILMGILGRLDPQKGQHLVLEALSQLRDQGTDLSLLIMGESTLNEGIDYRDHLESVVREYNLNDRVYFRGYREDIAQFFSAIDLFVLGSYEESYGMVTIEAMAHGVPVIGSDSGGTPGILGNGSFGWLYIPKDPQDLAKKITEVITNPASAEVKALRAKEYARETFSHLTECRKIELLINQLHKKIPHGNAMRDS